MHAGSGWASGADRREFRLSLRPAQRCSSLNGMGDVKPALLLVLGLGGLATQALLLGLVLAAAFGGVC